MLLKPLQFHTPGSLNEACRLNAELENAKILAGGTFLLNSLKVLKKKGARTPNHVISLRRVPELKGIEADGNQLTIRAMTRINELYLSGQLTDNFAVLRKVCKNISTNPIRNMASFGGNLTCRYTWTEMGAVMIALEATMHFCAGPGQETTLPAEEFFRNAARAPGIFTHVTIPREARARVAYRRVKKTLHVDVPLLAVCVKAVPDDERLTKVRVTVNNGNAFAQRDPKLESFLERTAVSPGTADEALDHLTVDIYDKRSDDYKKHMFRVSLRDCIREIIQG